MREQGRSTGCWRTKWELHRVRTSDRATTSLRQLGRQVVKDLKPRALLGSGILILL